MHLHWLSNQDFGKYMTYHNRKLLREQYAPALFSYAVRRPAHCPEGELCIEAQLGIALHFALLFR